MGNYSDCCRKAVTVNINSDLPLQCDTNYNNDSKNDHKNKRKEDYIRNRTIKRSSIFSPKQKDQKETNNLGTELNEINCNVRYKDDFMKNFTKLMRNVYYPYQISQMNRSLIEKEDFNVDSSFAQTININREHIPNLHINILNDDAGEEDSNLNNISKVLNISPFGLINGGSRREKLDGLTYFGIKKEKGELPKSSELDYVLDLDFEEYEDILNHTGNRNNFIPLFSIKFDVSTLRYNIKDLFSGISTISKVNNETVLRNNSLISIGDSYILVSFGELGGHSQVPALNINVFSYNVNSSQNLSSEVINIKVFNRNGQLIHDPINFQPSKSSIRIGRGKDAEIVVNDSTISRIHCTIQYEKVVGWTIRDGFFYKNDNLFVASVNGTWIYVGESSVIVAGSVFKCATLTFQCVFSDNLK